MLGLSITAIGMRSIDQCLDIFQTLREPMQLQYLELAIGSPCGVEVNYGNMPLILHDACLYQERMRLRLNPLLPKTWQPYAAFIADHDVRAVSLHPPLQRDCERSHLETALAQMEKTLQVPVFLEVMPSPEYWYSSLDTLVDYPLLVDVSHVLIWHHGDPERTQETCLALLENYPVGAIHLSHNNGQADAHDLIPESVWFGDRISQWSTQYFVTYESLPTAQAAYERLDKRARKPIHYK
ncbi:MAG: hypothetical protein KME45_22435 [Stenomitos rutilans HA7619-LM2]|jgi:hypothetical protein|nr:hypothetical protein [Stenomitos rutilans HA7619-LM2]